MEWIIAFYLSLIFFSNINAKTLRPLLIDGVHLSQSYKATMQRQFTFHYQVLRGSWYSFYQPRENGRLSRHWSRPVGLNPGPLDCKSSFLTTMPLLHVFNVSPRKELSPSLA